MKVPFIPDNMKLYKKSDVESYIKQIEEFEKHIGPQKGARILEIGAGEGVALSILEINGYEAYGIEPQEKYIKNARIIFENNGLNKEKIKQYFSENIPFPDNYFDYVISFQVLEHVKDVKKTFQEIERILKIGGKTFHICPNYQTFCEGHYGVPMLPFMDKNLFKKYIYLLKKIIFWNKIGPDIDYIDSLNFIKPKDIEEINRSLDSLNIINKSRERIVLASKQFMNNVSKARNKTLTHNTIRLILLTFYKLGIFLPLIKFIANRDYYPNFFLTGSKFKK